MHSNRSVHGLVVTGHRTTNTRARRVWALAVSSVLGAALGAVACLQRPLCDVDCQPRTTNVFVASIKSQNVDKIDLLFMIDNSASMADKQTVLQEAVPDLVRRLVNPNCVNPGDGASTPAPEGGCPSPMIPEFTPIRDIHVGIITSSLGAHGSTSPADCAANEADLTQMMNDHAWLVGTRSRFHVPAGGDPVDPTKGFLDWNPATHPNQSVGAFNTTFKEMTIAAGSEGCGFESQLESIYRFLVDPHPPAGIVIGKCAGTDVECASRDPRDDQTLLAQRAAFLRPDSLVAIIMLTDENDCSINESSPQGYYASSSNKAVPRASSACTSNPNDACCYSCGANPPPNCAADPACKSEDKIDDPPNLRCFNQVQRFGRDFLYPTQRYVNAFREPYICTSRDDLDATHCPDHDGDRAPDIVENPLMKGIGAVSRSSSLVFLAGIVGVPWQDIATATKPDGKPYPDANELHYQTAAQMTANKTWDIILGNSRPGNNQPPILPTDALMHESNAPRGGSDAQNPPQALAGTEAGYLANKVNGHEWAIPDRGDLEYACIFPLIKPRSCDGALATAPGCDCKQKDLNAGSKNPLCQDESGNYTTDQIFGKAYPGLRELQVLKDYGDNSIVASICARKLKEDEKGAQDWGYRPAVDAIVDRLKVELTGSCLPRQLRPDKTGQIPCSVAEVRPVPSSGRPACETIPGRREANSAVATTSIEQMRRAGNCDALNKPACKDLFVCEIVEAGDECHTGKAPSSPGWCYIDPAIQPNDNPQLVASCPATQRRSINFVDPDHRTPANGAVALVACFGSQIQDEEAPSATPLQSTGMP